MHVHILGICGTFMGGLALLARSMGHKVTGADLNVYPPISTQLEQSGIVITEGYDPAALDPPPDCVVIGNALSRGNPSVEYVLETGLNYTSGPQWLSENVLREKWVLAIAGTHGKTTTSSMLAWILEKAGMQPGFLIGGIPLNFDISARLGNTPFFVIEADEYDTAFFDKRSKFVHYHPRTLVLNNLEFDHADIFPDLASIQKQFHHLVRTVPGQGLIIYPKPDQALQQVIDMGCWSCVETLGSEEGWQAVRCSHREWDILFQGKHLARLDWDIPGEHNMANALSAIAAARHVGVSPKLATEALAEFRSVKRRMELRGEIDGVRVYDDFAHHPTAIEGTIAALRDSMDNGRLVAVFEPRSNTMKMGVHKNQLWDSLAGADQVFFYNPSELGWEVAPVKTQTGEPFHVLDSVQAIIDEITQNQRPGDCILIMSNGGFENIHARLLESLKDHVRKS